MCIDTMVWNLLILEECKIELELAVKLHKLLCGKIHCAEISIVVTRVAFRLNGSKNQSKAPC